MSDCITCLNDDNRWGAQKAFDRAMGALSVGVGGAYAEYLESVPHLDFSQVNRFGYNHIPAEGRFYPEQTSEAVHSLNRIVGRIAEKVPETASASHEIRQAMLRSVDNDKYAQGSCVAVRNSMVLAVSRMFKDEGLFGEDLLDINKPGSFMDYVREVPEFMHASRNTFDMYGVWDKVLRENDLYAETHDGDYLIDDSVIEAACYGEGEYVRADMIDRCALADMCIRAGEGDAASKASQFVMDTLSAYEMGNRRLSHMNMIAAYTVLYRDDVDFDGNGVASECIELLGEIDEGHFYDEHLYKFFRNLGSALEYQPSKDSGKFDMTRIVSSAISGFDNAVNQGAPFEKWWMHDGVGHTTNFIVESVRLLDEDEKRAFAKDLLSVHPEFFIKGSSMCDALCDMVCSDAFQDAIENLDSVDIPEHMIDELRHIGEVVPIAELEVPESADFDNSEAFAPSL